MVGGQKRISFQRSHTFKPYSNVYHGRYRFEGEIITVRTLVVSLLKWKMLITSLCKTEAAA